MFVILAEIFFSLDGSLKTFLVTLHVTGCSTKKGAALAIFSMHESEVKQERRLKSYLLLL